MMKTLFTITISLLLTHSVCCQNLVVNGSFESTSCCPTWGDELWDGSNCISNWFNPNDGSPDYYNQCSSNLSVPYHGGFQYARTGNAYGGVFCYVGFDTREYLEAELNYPLINGRRYGVEFYVNLSNASLYSVDAIGAFFSNDSLLNDSNSVFFPVTPQIENSLGNNIDDTLNWVRIYGEFIAVGGEKFVTIGNFRSDFNTDIDTTTWGFDSRAYYYVEDVSIWDYDSANSVPTHSSSLLHVNSFLRNDDYLIATNLPASSVLNIYDSRGRIAYFNENYQNELSGSQLSYGLYIYEFILPDKSRKVGKLIVQ